MVAARARQLPSQGLRNGGCVDTEVLAITFFWSIFRNCVAVPGQRLILLDSDLFQKNLTRSFPVTDQDSIGAHLIAELGAGVKLSLSGLGGLLGALDRGSNFLR